MPDFREIRKQAKMTQAELAARSGIRQATISALENGRSSAHSATVLALAIVDLALPWLKSAFGVGFSALQLSDPGTIGAFLGLAAIIGALSGFYPALVLSSFRPVEALGARGAEPSSTMRLRSALVVLQFTASIGLIIGTAVIYKQTSFASSADLGFEKSNVIVLSRMTRSAVQDNVRAFYNQVMSHPDTSSAGFSDNIPGDDFEGNTTVRRPQDSEGTQNFIGVQNIEYNFLQTLDVEPVAGRLFSESFPADLLVAPDPESELLTGGVILNMSAVRQIGFESAAAAIGQDLVISDGATRATVVGVIPDVRFRSIRFDVRPNIFFLEDDPLFSMVIRHRAEDVTAYLGELEGIWKTTVPDAPIVLEFLDEKIEKQYGSESRWARLFLVFSGFAISISCLGLFGLAAFTAEKRTREIGIRKVMGATVRDIIQLFAWQITRPVLWANLIAWPIAWYFVNDWLTGFSYRIDLTPVYFIEASIVAVLIAWGTVAGHAWRVARTNPVHALHYE